MVERFTISMDKKTYKQFEEITQQLEKSKSKTIQEFIKFFHKYLDFISNGIMINDAIFPTLNENNNTQGEESE